MPNRCFVCALLKELTFVLIILVLNNKKMFWAFEHNAAANFDTLKDTNK